MKKPDRERQRRERRATNEANRLRNRAIAATRRMALTAPGGEIIWAQPDPVDRRKLSLPIRILRALWPWSRI